MKSCVPRALWWAFEWFDLDLNWLDADDNDFVSFWLVWFDFHFVDSKSWNWQHFPAEKMTDTCDLICLVDQMCCDCDFVEIQFRCWWSTYFNAFHDWWSKQRDSMPFCCWAVAWVVCSVVECLTVNWFVVMKLWNAWFSLGGVSPWFQWMWNSRTTLASTQPDFHLTRIPSCKHPI